MMIFKDRHLIIQSVMGLQLSENNPTKNLLYFKEKYNIPATQIVFKLKTEIMKHGVEIRDGIKFLKELSY